MQTEIAFKILSPSEWGAFECAGRFDGGPVDIAEGFIHMSTAEQLDRTLHKHYRGNDDLYITIVNLESLGDQVRWEMSKSGQLYPHLYGSLPLKAIIGHGPLERNTDGTLRLPPTD